MCSSDLDEVQKLPQLLDVVHLCIEELKIKFALTGSSSRKLKRGSANLLANRAASYFLSPLTAVELSSDFDLKEALTTGLLPLFWNNKELTHADKIKLLYSYVQTYLKEEIAAEQLVRNLEPFRRLLIAAAQSNAKIINYAAIERDAGISASQAERHFELLIDTHIGRHLNPYDQSIRKRQSKKSKFYFFDCGVVRTLTNLVGESLSPSTYEYGDLFETFLINEVFKLAEALEKPWRFSYLKTKENLEIDLIIEKPRGLPVLIEIKSTNKKPTTEMLKSIFKLGLEVKHAKAYLLSNYQHNFEHNNVHCLHWQSGLKEIFALEN